MNDCGAENRRRGSCPPPCSRGCAGSKERVNALEVDEQGRYLCHWCKCPVSYASMGIKVIIENGRVIRIGTCGEHFSNTSPVASST